MKLVKWVLGAVLCMNVANASSTLEASLVGLSFDYNEYDVAGKWLDSETSGYDDVLGFEMRYHKPIYKSEDFWHNIELGARYIKGETEYNGHLQDLRTGALTPYKTHTDVAISEGWLRYHIQNATSSNEAWVFVGIGYRHWERNLQGPYGYDETYMWPYGEVGLRGRWSDGAYTTGFDASARLAYEPKLDALGMSFDLGQTWGYSVRVPLMYEINPRLSVGVEYMYEWWESGRSNVVGGFFEPDSETKNQWVFFSIGYKF